MKFGDTVYYQDEKNDDFAGTDIKSDAITKDFNFAPKGFWWRVMSFVIYYCIALPIVCIICFVFSGFSIKNREHIKKLKKQKRGFFLYANHTHWLDAFVFPLVCFPKRAYVLVSADAVSIKGLRHIIQWLGAIPVPSNIDGMKPFTKALEQRINEGGAIGIFPEAHIWPYCNFIRDFKVGSFRYPCIIDTATVGVCVTYQKRKGLFSFRKGPKRNIYISCPYFYDRNLDMRSARQILRDDVYDMLCKTADKYSNYEYIKYVKKQRNIQ